MFNREKLLIGDNINKLHNSNIIIFGVGGVGGYALEMLVRAGVENITIVDYDTVDISNKNRQIIALDSTIGRKKVDVFVDRIKDINSNCKITPIDNKLTPENISEFNLKNFDFIIDAIDMVSSKVSLIAYAKQNNIPIISAMGAGNRFEIPQFEITDIYKTSGDGLAKILRKKLRDLGILEHKVVFCKNNAIVNAENNAVASISYYPAISGCMIASFVVNELIK